MRILIIGRGHFKKTSASRMKSCSAGTCTAVSELQVVSFLLPLLVGVVSDIEIDSGDRRE